MPDVRYPDVTVVLSDALDQGAFALVSLVGSALRKAGVPVEEREAFGAEALGAAAFPTRERVLRVAEQWVVVT